MNSARFYYFTAFVSGLAVMAVEMTASRLLSPFFGTSLFVWTNVIGLVMVSLSFGYFFGGRLADKYPKPKPYFTLILCTGLWVFLLPFVSGFVIDAIVGLFPRLTGLMVSGSFLAVLFLIVTPMFLLGMIVPYTVKLVTHKMKELGRASGQVSSLSTLGSILGTFLPAFVLIPVFGVSNTFLLLGLMLFLVAAVGLKKWWVFFFGFLLIPSFWIAPDPAFAGDNVIYLEESPYQLIFVKEYDSGRRELYIDNQFGIQSIYEADTPLVSAYYSFFSVLPSMVKNPEKILILGHAGGSYTRIFNEFYPEIDVTGVELDPRVTAVSQEHFFLDELSVNIVHGDARSFLLSTDETYDVIILDAYNVMSIPPHLATQEFFELVSGHLSDGGVFGVNALSHESVFLTDLGNSVASVFEEVILAKIPTSLNSMIIARDGDDFEAISLPSDLEIYNEYIQKEATSVSFDPSLEVFTDDKSSLVELKTQEMMMDLYSF